MVFLLVYIDDILITRENPSTIHTLINYLNSSFSLKTLGPVHYFLSFEVHRATNALHLQQNKYASDFLAITNMLQAKPSSTPMCIGNKLHLNDSPPFSQPSLYQSTIGTSILNTH